VAVTPADLEAIKQAIIGAINSAAGTASGGATVGDPAEIARLEAYVQTLNRANAALGRQEQRAQSLSNATERQNELNRIRIERQQNLIEGYETDIALNNQRGPGYEAVNAAIQQQIELAEIAIQKLEEDTRSKPVYKSRPKVLIPRDGKENRSLTHAMEVRDIDDNTGTISGYGAVFNSPSLLLSGGFIETVSPGAFKKSLNERGTQTSKEDIFAYWNHNSDIVLGSKRAGTLRLKEDETGLSYEIDMDLRSQEVRDKYYTVQRGNVSSSSFGFDVPKDGDQWILPQNDEEPVQRVLRSVRLHEVSIVSTPAYPESGSWVSRSLESLAQASGINIDEIEDAIDKKDLRSLILERVESSDDHSIEVNADIRSRKLYLMSKKNDIRLDS